MFKNILRKFKAFATFPHRVLYSTMFRSNGHLGWSQRGSRGRDHIVVGFINTYAISAYHH
jgi:hypothetical protein